jgi:hypothetical protein
MCLAGCDCCWRRIGKKHAIEMGIKRIVPAHHALCAAGMPQNKCERLGHHHRVAESARVSAEAKVCYVMCTRDALYQCPPPWTMYM